MLQEDLEFLLFDVLQLEELMTRPRFQDHDRDVVRESLQTAVKLSRDSFAGHCRKGDLQEPEWDGKKDSPPTIIPEVRQACRDFVDAGMMNAHGDYQTGGLQLPFAVTTAMMMTVYAANVGSSGYPMLTIAAGNLLRKHGTDVQKRELLEPMTAGSFFGTMNLSEPSVGSSLGDITTTAQPCGDGAHYLVSGSKMWISGGDHDLSENIVVRSLWLARHPGGRVGSSCSRVCQPAPTM